MIWAVKILALNKKDGKGNDLYLLTKKSLPTKTPPKSRKTRIPGPETSFTLSKFLLLPWREFIRDYLTFTRKERIGLIVVAGLILFTIFLPDLLSGYAPQQPAQMDTAWMAAVKKLAIKAPDSSGNDRPKNDDDRTYTYQFDKTKSSYESSLPKRELFYFDPNTISISEWKKLGLRDKTIKTIENYLRKGGHFYKPEDLQKIYGLHDDEYQRLKPFIKIESNPSKAKEEFVSSKSGETQPAKTFGVRYSIIDVNTADTSAFISLPGIGSKLASRIITFREKLGGFYSVEQVGETYGLPDSTFQKIKQYLKLDNTLVKKININTATIDELMAHPYVGKTLANPIVAYRNEHGAFSKIEDIKKVMAVTDEIYKKIAPYLTI